MEPVGSKPHPQGLSNISYPEPNEPNRVLIPIYLWSILILSSHLRLCLPKGLFHVGVPVKNFQNTPSFFYSGFMTYPSQFSRLKHPDYIRWTVKTMKLRILNLFYSPFSSLLGPYIRLGILLSNTLILHSSLSVRDRVSQPYSRTGNIMFYIF